MVIFSKHGYGLTMRFQTIANLLRAFPAKSAIIDCEIVANNRAGVPDFFSLHTRSADPGAMNVWAFDLLMLNGRHLREQSLEKRKARLHALVERLDCPGVLMSQAFADGKALLRAAKSIALRAWSASAERHPIDRVRAAIGRRSRRKPGLRRTGSGGGYSNRDQGPGKCANDCEIAGAFLFGLFRGEHTP